MVKVLMILVENHTDSADFGMSDVMWVEPAVLGKQAPMSGYITLKALCENKRLELGFLELSADFKNVF